MAFASGISLASSLLGALAAFLGNSLGEIGGLAGGSVATAATAVLLGRALAGDLQPWRSTLSWLFLGVALTASTSLLIGNPFPWTFFGWSVGGSILGILLGAMGDPVRVAKGGALDVPGDGWLFLILAWLLAMIVKRINRYRLGYVLAGMLGGATGSIMPAFVVFVIGGKDADNWLGGSLRICLIAGITLGTIGGGAGGWRSYDEVPE